MSRRRAFGLVVSIAIATVAAEGAARSATVDATVGPSGKIAFSERIIDKYDAYRIVVVSADGGRRNVLPVGDRHSWSPAWSPDATKIAFVTADFNGGRPEVWVMNANGSAQRRLTRSGDEPAWSPDGRSIAFSRADDIYVMGSDGSGKRRLTRNGTVPAWSPDGRRIAFVRAVAQGCYRRNPYRPRCVNSRELYVMRADGTGQERLTRNRFSEYSPDWSPTGTKIAYDRVRAPDGGSDVFVMNADGTGQRRLTSIGAAYDPSWSPDATKIVYTLQGAYIYTIRADGSGKRRLYPGYPFPCEGCGSPDWSRE